MSQLGGLSPYTIGGSLNFGTVPSQTDYMGAYSNALNLNEQNYANILQGYQGLGATQAANSNQIAQGYGQLSSAVLGDIQGIGASQAQAIQDTYAQQSGNSAQQLINSGLGNTTVQQSVQRGNLLDEQKAQTGLANQMAQLTAGYQSSLGLAGLNYDNQANMQNTALGSQQLGFMNSVNAPYPNAQAYNDYALQQQTLALARQGASAGMLNRGGGGVTMPSGGGSGGNRAPGTGTGSQGSGSGSGGGSGGGGDGGYANAYWQWLAQQQQAQNAQENGSTVQSSPTTSTPSGPMTPNPAVDPSEPAPVDMASSDSATDAYTNYGMVLAGWSGGGGSNDGGSRDAPYGPAMLFAPGLPEPPKGDVFNAWGGAMYFPPSSRKRRSKQRRRAGQKGKLKGNL